MEDHNGSVSMMTGTWRRKESYRLSERLESSCLSMSRMSFTSFSATTVGGVISPNSNEPPPSSQCAAVLCADDCAALGFAAFGCIACQESYCHLVFGHAGCECKVYAALIVGVQQCKTWGTCMQRHTLCLLEHVEASLVLHSGHLSCQVHDRISIQQQN